MQFPKLNIKTTEDLPAFLIDGFDLPVLSGAPGKPFFHILTDGGVAALFLEAVIANPDAARAFVSKHYVNAIDIEALRDVLAQADKSRLCSAFVQASYDGEPKNCQTRTMMVVDPERNVKSVLHLHMIKEPDKYGPWKIYGVEQE